MIDNETLEDKIIVTVIATGFDLPQEKISYKPITDAKHVSESLERDHQINNDDESDIPGFFKSRG